MNLEKRVSKIKSKEDLVDFLAKLKKDLEENPGDWENYKLEFYLEGMRGWLHDLDGWCRNQNISVPEQPSWELVGQMLLAAKYYE